MITSTPELFKMSLTTGIFISKLESTVMKFESLLQVIENSNFHPTTDQWQALDDLSARVTTAKAELQQGIAALIAQGAKPSEEGQKMVAQAQLDIRSLMTKCQMG